MKITKDYARYRRIREVMAAFHTLAPALRGTKEWPDFVEHVNSELCQLRARQRVGSA